MNLDMIRRRHKWLTLGILVFISIAFIFGIGSFVTDFGTTSGGPVGTAAEVNGEEISLSQYIRIRNNMRSQYSDREGALPQAAVDFINVSALNQLIDIKLLAQKSKELGYRVTDDEVAQAIRSVFEVDGQFVGTERYQNIVQEGMKEDLVAYENSVKEQLLAQKLGRLIGQTVMVTDEKLLNKYNLQNEKANLYFIEYSNADYNSAEDPTEDEIKRHYEKKKQEFKTDELRKIRYVVFEPETFQNNVQISDEELQAYYNAYPEEFISEDGNIISFEEAKADVENNLKSQRSEASREDFLNNFGLTESTQKSIEQIAKDNGIDTIDETKPFAQTDRTGDVPPMVVNKAYSIEQGNLAIQPVGTSLWVIELSEIAEPREKTLEETRPAIIADLKQQKSKNQARREANQTLSKLRTAKDGDSIAKAKELGVNLKETGPFTRVERIPTVNHPDVTSEVFEIDKAGTVLSRVYEVNNNFYVLILKERISADPEQFDSQKEQLKQEELQTQINKTLEKWLQNLRREADIVPNYEIFPAQG